MTVRRPPLSSPDHGDPGSTGPPAAVRLVQALAGLVLVAYVVQLELALGGDAVEAAFVTWVYPGLIFTAAGLALARACVRATERLAWTAIGAALAAWGVGEAHFALFLADLDPTPVPTFGDIAYLAFYGLAGIGLAMLVRARMQHITWGLGLDALIAGLATASLGVPMFGPVLDAFGGEAEPLAVAVNLAYPFADLALLALVVGSLTFAGWRPSPSYLLLSAGLTTAAIADGAFLYLVVTDRYVEGHILDALWPASLLLIGSAAWARAGECGGAHAEDPRVPIVTTACAVIALGVSFYAPVGSAPAFASTLPLICLGTVILRLAGTLRQNRRLLAATRGQAATDALTGLGNRRRLLDDLESELRRATSTRPAVLAIFDLDGFKAYNDAFGHPAGDALLVRLGAKLSRAVEGRGHAYRMGGDEFCVLLRGSSSDAQEGIEAARAALSERGGGFAVAPSSGMAAIPREADHVALAVQLADRRMYDDKSRRRAMGAATATGQAHEVVRQALSEEEHPSGAPAEGLARLTAAVARRVGLEEEAVAEASRAARLQDIGTVAMPDDLVDKQGSLDEDESAFMRQHPVLGEHILDSRPTLGGVARIVRSTHERWDGKGYPDGLAGEAIPLAARIIAVCRDYDALTAEGRGDDRSAGGAALAEVCAAAGSRFDPEIVTALSEEIETIRRRKRLSLAG